MNWKNVLLSPRIWAAFLTIVFVVVSTYVPAVTAKLDTVKVISGVTALVGFIAALSVSTSPTFLNELLAKPQFWILVAQLGFVFISAYVPNFPIKEDLVLALIAAFDGVSVGGSYRAIGTAKSP